MGNTATKVVAVDPVNDVFGPTTHPNKEVAALGARLVRGVNYVNDLELKLKEAKAKLRELQEQLLPSAMLQAGIGEFESPVISQTDGPLYNATIRLTSVVSAKIPKKRQEEAMQYLNSMGYGDQLIKAGVTVLFRKGEYQEAVEFSKGLKEDGFTVEVKESVHGQTLKAWVKENVPKGIQLDLDLLGVYVGNRAIVVGHEQDEPETEE